MCGIIGILGEAEAQTAERMLAAISHRGQDASRFRWFDHFGAIGINRLSTIDLERGDQPIFNEDGTLALVCNGEIYNHAAIRRDLDHDHDFCTHSDVEVILHLYEEYGDEGVKFLDGMFAFILFDFRRGRVLLGRDPVEGRVQLGIADAHARAHAHLQLNALQDETVQGLPDEFVLGRQLAVLGAKLDPHQFDALAQLAAHDHVVLDDGDDGIQYLGFGGSGYRDHQQRAGEAEARHQRLIHHCLCILE